METGLIQVYTGNGKGKTTAAIGQGVRSAGSGLKVFMIQFLKNKDTGELHSLKKIEDIFKVFRFEKERDFFWLLNDEQKKELREEVGEAFKFAKDSAANKSCDVLILDEIIGAINNGLLEEAEVRDMLKAKPKQLEIILTGRNVPDSILEVADYVSEIKAIKHPADSGINARKGIEY